MWRDVPFACQRRRVVGVLGVVLVVAGVTKPQAPPPPPFTTKSNGDFTDRAYFTSLAPSDSMCPGDAHNICPRHTNNIPLTQGHKGLKGRTAFCQVPSSTNRRVHNTHAPTHSHVAVL